MSNERAVLWIGVSGLMALGLILGQAAAISVAAMVGACLAYLSTRPNAA